MLVNEQWRNFSPGRLKETPMVRGSKEKYTDKQKRKAEHIEESYKDKGLSDEEAERRAWATVNKQSGGGEKGGSGNETSKKEKKEARSDSAHNAAETRKRRSSNGNGKDTSETKKTTHQKKVEAGRKGGKASH